GDIHGSISAPTGLVFLYDTTHNTVGTLPSNVIVEDSSSFDFQGTVTGNLQASGVEFWDATNASIEDSIIAFGDGHIIVVETPTTRTSVGEFVEVYGDGFAHLS